MVEASLLTDDVRALIGRRAPATTVRVSPRMVLRAADLYTGRPLALPAEGGPVPGYVMVALDAEVESPPLPPLLPDSILISNEWLFERPLRLGEELLASGLLADVVERFGGRFGYSLHWRSEVEFRDPGGTLVARSVRTMMQYDAANARDGDEP